jgi:hypothetical protein
VRLFTNPRFTAASVAVTLVFFALFGTLFFVSQYLQFVLGYSALLSGAALVPVAVVLMIVAPLSARLVARIGTKLVVTTGLLLVAAALLLFSRVSVDSGYPLVGAVLVIIAAGMGLAIAPATDSIMGSVPREKAGVGSAMNDTTREIGGALGVAVMGSLTAAAYTSTIVANGQFAALEKASPAAADAVRESVGNAAIAAGKFPASVAHAITSAANSAFVDALGQTVVIAAVVAFVGAAVAFFFLPAHARGDDAVDQLASGAALRLRSDPEERRSLASAALGLLADAGMSSLTYNALASRSGISTATLQRYWTSRVHAVTDAMREVFAAHPVPDTGDPRRDLAAYLHDVGDVISTPRARRVLGVLVAEGGSIRSSPRRCVNASSARAAGSSPSGCNATTRGSDRSRRPSTSSSVRCSTGRSSSARRSTTRSSSRCCRGCSVRRRSRRRHHHHASGRSQPRVPSSGCNTSSLQRIWPVVTFGSASASRTVASAKSSALAQSSSPW